MDGSTLTNSSILISMWTVDVMLHPEQRLYSSRFTGFGPGATWLWGCFPEAFVGLEAYQVLALIMGPLPFSSH